MLERVSKKVYFNPIETGVSSNKDDTFDVRMTNPDRFKPGGRYQIV